MDRDGEPGTARFGNFINYYSFNPAQKRTSLLPDDLLMSENITDEKKIAHVLDVGCNSGVSCECVADYVLCPVPFGPV